MPTMKIHMKFEYPCGLKAEWTAYIKSTFGNARMKSNENVEIAICPLHGKNCPPSKEK